MQSNSFAIPLGRKRAQFPNDGEKLNNITEWALKRFREAYGKGLPSPLVGEGGSARSDETDAGGAAGGAPPHPPASPAPSPRGEKGGPQRQGRALSKDDIFHYVYGVLHDPVYREKYAINLKREFPRIPFYPDFWAWAAWGERLMALHVGYRRSSRGR
ncbi:type ISP restriction/modification enzyme [Hoeflea sp. BAL378]|uniref:type ISP restriction/modification enzyme n=1 Tax=Hoeflea sp. BAL378 TaxID=1547437 RepID=UPI001376F0D6|nr:type ISP restriction/modification enzyme [Hoeflea sp. BAL378]